MRAAKPNREIAVGGQEIADNVFVAYFDRIFGRLDPVFLEYRLPAIAVAAPLQVGLPTWPVSLCHVALVGPCIQYMFSTLKQPLLRGKQGWISLPLMCL